MAKKALYSHHLDTIVALVSYLAITNAKSRTPSRLATDLSLDEKEVQFVLDNFKSLFRKSKKPSPQNTQYFYTLHTRYAFRSQATDDDDDVIREPLPPDYLSKILDFISNAAFIEHEQEKQKIISSNNIKTALLAAIISVFIGVITVYVNYLSQKISIQNQNSIKKYEVTFNKKREAYSDFMNNMLMLFIESTSKKGLDGSIDIKVFEKIFILEKSYYDLAPFLQKKTKENLYKMVGDFEDYSLYLAKNNLSFTDRSEISAKFRNFRDKFRDTLDENLFEKDELTKVMPVSSGINEDRH